MGRECRRVPANWEHPKGLDGNYKPMHDRAYEPEAREWMDGAVLWAAGKHPDQADDDASGYKYYWEWHGEPPDPQYYLPVWDDAERTHYQMYEDTTEGTPISPVMETPETLARWLADNGASAFGNMTATYDQWLATIKRGWAPSMIMTVKDGGRTMQSGVAATASHEESTT